MISIEQSIWNNASKTPDKVAVKSGKDSITYNELCRKICAARNYFLALENYSPRKVVLLAANKQIGFVYAYFGAHMAGLTVVPIDAETNPARFDFITKAVTPFCVAGFDKVLGCWQNVSLKEFDKIEGVESDVDEFPDMDAVADILFTTGTTGTKKRGSPQRSQVSLTMLSPLFW